MKRKLLRAAGEKMKRLGRAKPLEPAPEKPAPKSGDASFQKPASEKALRYNTMRAPEGTAFTDTRDRSYETGPKGQLRALNKPRSRVKRLREERRSQTERKKPAGI